MCPAGDVDKYRCGGFLGQLVGTLTAWGDFSDVVRFINTRVGIHREKWREVVKVDAVYLAGVKGDERLLVSSLAYEELTYGDEASELLHGLCLYTRASIDVVAFVLIETVARII